MKRKKKLLMDISKNSVSFHSLTLTHGRQRTETKELQSYQFHAQLDENDLENLCIFSAYFIQISFEAQADCGCVHLFCLLSEM